MYKTITASDSFELLRAVDELMSQHLKFPINSALRIVKLKGELEETTKYISERIVEVIPRLKDDTELTEEEKKMYNSILMSQIWIENFEITETDLTSSVGLVIDPILLEKFRIVL